MCRGDWLRTFTYGAGKPVCAEYTTLSGGKYIDTLPPNHIFGPVHEVQQSGDYTAVAVPSRQDMKQIVWVNVSKSNIAFATKIAPGVQENWKAAGWRNRFCRTPNGAALGTRRIEVSGEETSLEATIANLRSEISARDKAIANFLDRCGARLAPALDPAFGSSNRPEYAITHSVAGRKRFREFEGTCSHVGHDRKKKK